MNTIFQVQDKFLYRHTKICLKVGWKVPKNFKRIKEHGEKWFWVKIDFLISHTEKFDFINQNTSIEQCILNLNFIGNPSLFWGGPKIWRFYFDVQKNIFDLKSFSDIWISNQGIKFYSFHYSEAQTCLHQRLGISDSSSFVNGVVFRSASLMTEKH